MTATESAMYHALIVLSVELDGALPVDRMRLHAFCNQVLQDVHHQRETQAAAPVAQWVEVPVDDWAGTCWEQPPDALYAQGYRIVHTRPLVAANTAEMPGAAGETAGVGHE